MLKKENTEKRKMSYLQSNKNPSSLFASIDMGTNSFKLLIVHADPCGRFFFSVDKLKEPVVLSRESPTSISPQSQLRALESLQKFKQLVLSYNVSGDRTRCVATEALREAENQKQFLLKVIDDVGFEVDVLSGEEEARLVYLGVLQFLPVFEKSVLCFDIGGGSTEFVVGKHGIVKYAVSLKLGHVNLTQEFVRNGIGLLKMRDYIRTVIEESGLVDKVKECGGFEVAVGSSGTIKAVENAVFHGYGNDSSREGDNACSEVYKRDWRFSRRELNSVVERLCGKEEEEKIRREEFFKRRSEFIVAGAILLEEIFGVLGIEEIEVSDYALGEGVIADTLNKAFGGFDLNSHARWRSIMRSATRFSGKKRMKTALHCAHIAKEVFEGLRKCNELGFASDDKDLEHLEAACLLHNIGLSTGKKGYHKQSFRIIKNGDHLQGFSAEEVKLIALLTRYHRKKFPKFDHASLEGFPEEAKQKFMVMCVIIRLAVTLQQNKSMDIQEVEFSESCGSFKLVLKQYGDKLALAHGEETKPEDNDAQLKQEMEHFKRLFKKDLMVVSSEQSERC